MKNESVGSKDLFEIVDVVLQDGEVLSGLVDGNDKVVAEIAMTNAEGWEVDQAEVLTAESMGSDEIFFTASFLLIGQQREDRMACGSRFNVMADGVVKRLDDSWKIDRLNVTDISSDFENEEV